MSELIVDWVPWEKFRQELDAIDVIEPPCKRCSHWKPKRKYMGTIYDGVVMCHAPEMHSDFSCYKKKENAQ